ncbi:MAG: ABC transporter substrate-binding protein [Candidatus Limnocylindrales bacterium]
MLDRKLTLLVAALLAATVATQACSSSATTAPAAAAGSPGALAPATLTLWHNYGTEANATATQNLVNAFEKLYPQIKINVVSQPAANYFDLLQAAAISKTGPDLATMWTGLFALKYQSYLQPLNNLVPMADLLKLKGIQYSSINFNPSDGVLVVPLEVQFYNGFYNKALFAKAGLDPNSFPTTWDQFFAACAKLKAAGILPMVYGTGGQALGGGFYPWYDVSYLMMMYTPEQWKGLYDGQIPWTSPAIASQFDKWVSLFKQGYTNQDVMTNSNSIAQFESGQAAMTMEGTWEIAEFQQKMGNNVGVFIPPFSDTPIHGVVEYSGDGFSMTSYSQHKPQAAAFLKYLASDAAQKVIADSGLIPPKDGFTSPQPMAQDLLAYAAKDGYTRYPMLDNVIQPEVADPVGTKIINAMFAGAMSVQGGLNSLQQALMQLPADRRGTTYK